MPNAQFLYQFAHSRIHKVRH